VKFTIDSKLADFNSCIAMIKHELQERSTKDHTEVFKQSIQKNVGGKRFLVDHKVDEISIEIITREAELNIKRCWALIANR